MKFLEVQYPDYYGIGVCLLTEEEKVDTAKYYYHFHRDLIYSGFNEQFLMAFLSQLKYIKKKKKRTNNENTDPVDAAYEVEGEVE